MIVPKHVLESPQCLLLERVISEIVAAKAMVATVCVRPAQRPMELVTLLNIRVTVYTDSVNRVIISLELYWGLKTKIRLLSYAQKIFCSLLDIAIVSETVYASNKRCPGILFRLEPHNDPTITKAMCKQHCIDNAECNFYAYWSGGSGQGDCRAWTTCPTLENISGAYKNTVYMVDRTTSGAYFHLHHI